MQFARLADVKSWLGLSTNDDDAFLTTLISQISDAILNYCSRPLFYKASYSEIRNGNGQPTMALRNYPVLAISGLTISGSSISAATSGTALGYVLAPWDGSNAGSIQQLSLRGYRYTKDYGNVTIDYTAGYAIANEAHTIPGSIAYTITVDETYGQWAQDDGVVSAAGVVFTKVTGSPSAGQYSVTNGVYTFNAANASTAMLISYSYTPAAITEACIEWVGERYSYKQRIGQTSRTLGGQETAAFNLKTPEQVKLLLEPFKRDFVP